MKQIKLSSVLLLTALAFSSIISCQKDDPQINPVQETSCLINTISNDEGETMVQLSYNESGKLTKASIGSTNLNIEHNGNTIYINGTNTNGEFVSKSILTLNKEGFVITIHSEYDETGSNWQDSQYEYLNGTQLVKHTYTSSTSSQPFVNNFTWEDGNLISAESGSGKETVYSYYTDMPTQIGDYFNYIELMNLGGARLYNCKNALKSYEVDNVSTTFSYQTDQENRINGILYKTGINPAQTVTYGYQCN